MSQEYAELLQRIENIEAASTANKISDLYTKIDALENDNRFLAHIAVLRQEMESMNKDYFLEVSKGSVPGTTAGFVSGRNTNIGATNSETIWFQGGNYEYLSADTQLYASSTSASDTDVDLLVVGLDDNYTEVVRTVNLNGQSQVAISDLMFRVHSFFTASTSANTPVGDVYLAESDTLTAGVPDTSTKIKAVVSLTRNSAGTPIDTGTVYASDNFSHLGIFTVPAGKTLFGLYLVDYLGKNDDATITGVVRPFGGHWLSRSPTELYQSPSTQLFSTRTALPEKTDLEFRVIAGSAGASINIQFQFILVDN